MAAGRAFRVLSGVVALDQLRALFAQTWWASARDEADVEAIVAGSDLVLTVVDLDGELVAFARVLTDWAHIALVLDVVVAEGHRGTGVGRLLMEAVVGDERLSNVVSIELVCRPDVVDFYRLWDFEPARGSQLMRRTLDPSLRD